MHYLRAVRADLPRCGDRDPQQEDRTPAQGADDRIQIEQENFFINQEKALSIFKNFPNALKNTVTIAEQCQWNWELGIYKFPKIHTQKGRSYEPATPYRQMVKLCFKGLRSRLKIIKKEE